MLETQAIALLADISHFTTVAERLQARYGVEGADRLSELLNIIHDRIGLPRLGRPYRPLRALQDDLVRRHFACRNDRPGGRRD